VDTLWREKSLETYPTPSINPCGGLCGESIDIDGSANGKSSTTTIQFCLPTSLVLYMRPLNQIIRLVCSPHVLASGLEDVLLLLRYRLLLHTRGVKSAFHLFIFLLFVLK